MKFWKMQSAGNDYVYVDIRGEKTQADWPAVARLVSDRHFGIGSDGLVLLTEAGAGDCGMRIFNADGSEGSMCGNALCCIGRFLYEREQEEGRKEYWIETAAGLRIVQADRAECGVAVRVNMGSIRVEPRPVAVYLRRCMAAYRADAGNPHLVLFCGIPNAAEAEQFGRRLQKNSRYPDGCNVEFCEILARDCMQVLVWERGSGRTLACGSGAAAAFAAGRMLGLVDARVRMRMPGGELSLSEENGEVWLSGPAQTVFEGTCSPENCIPGRSFVSSGRRE